MKGLKGTCGKRNMGGVQLLHTNKLPLVTPGESRGKTDIKKKKDLECAKPRDKPVKERQEGRKNETC